MDQICQSIIIGSILGDGTIYPSNKKDEAIFEFKYDDKSFFYLEWLHNQFKIFGVREIKSHRGFHQHRFRSFPNKEIGHLRKLFYPRGKKVIPETISKLLIDPLSLAIWYMDDGCLDFRFKEHCNATLATFSFSKEECELLAKTMFDNFNLLVRVHKNSMRGKPYYRLYVASGSMSQFINLIQPFILPCFSYKLPQFASSRGNT